MPHGLRAAIIGPMSRMRCGLKKMIKSFNRPDSVLKERLVKEGVQFLLFRRPRGTKRLGIQTNNLETKKKKSLDSDISLPNPVINGIFNPSNLYLSQISNGNLPQISNENLPQINNGNSSQLSNENLSPNLRKKKLSNSKPGLNPIPANFTINKI